MQSIPTLPLSDSLSKPIVGVFVHSETSKKISQLCTRTFQNPTFWILLQSSALLAFTAVAIANPFLLPTKYLISSLSVGLLALGVQVKFFYPKVLYETSLIMEMTKNFFISRQWWNEIDDQLILGAMPLSNKCHHTKLKDLGVSVVVSLNQDFELDHQGILSIPVTHEEWKKQGIEFRQFPAKDFKGVDLDTISRTVSYIQHQEEQGKKVYVHCKAGVGRSATIAACLQVLEKHSLSADEAIRIIKQKRPQISLNENQRRQVVLYSTTRGS